MNNFRWYTISRESLCFPSDIALVDVTVCAMASRLSLEDSIYNDMASDAGLVYKIAKAVAFVFIIGF